MSYRVDWEANFIKLLIGIFRTPKSPPYDRTPHENLGDLYIINEFSIQNALVLVVCVNSIITIAVTECDYPTRVLLSLSFSNHL